MLKTQSFGSQYKVKSTHDQKFYIIQTILKKCISDVDTFWKKINSCVSSHKNVISCLENFEDETFLYLRFDCLEEGLNKIVRRLNKKKRPSEDVVFCYFSQIFYGIEHIHNKGICHQNLSEYAIIFKKKEHNKESFEKEIRTLVVSDFYIFEHLTPKRCGHSELQSLKYSPVSFIFIFLTYISQRFLTKKKDMILFLQTYSH
jgi:serine/threonine protein kinase